MSKTNGKVAIFLILVSLVASLVVVEVALRIVGFSFRLYPEKIEFGYPNTEILASKYKEDSDLFWVQPGYYEKLNALLKSPPKILFMGDSCTEFGTYDRDLGKRLKNELGTKVTTSRLGVAGWSSYQGLQQMRRDVAQIKPRLVTVYFGWNDHWVGFGIEDKDVAKWHAGWVQFLQKFRVVQLLTRSYLSLVGRNYSVRPIRVSLKDFKSNLSEIVKIARQNNIEVLLLTAPTSQIQGREPQYLKDRFIERLEDLIPLHSSYVNAVREVSEESGAPLCDLAAEFAKLSQSELDNFHFKNSGIHLTPRGNQKIGEFLFKCLKEQNLIKNLVD